MKTLLLIISILGFIALLYSIGPSPKSPELDPALPVVTQSGAELEKLVAGNEAKHRVKPDNQARIVWANDSLKQKTKYAIVYMHGFSASQEEGNPIHRRVAKAFGCNLYLSRLAEHGLDTADAMQNFTVDKLWQSAKEALAIGSALGDSVILIGCSTGGTLNLIMATQYPQIKAIINMSPNIRINDPNAWILNNPWGLQIARLVVGGNENISRGQSEAFKKYWYDHYRLEAATELEELLERTMNEKTFAQVKKPVLDVYYFKDEINQDSVVKVSAIIEMHDALGTPDNFKKLVVLPTVGNHVMASPIKSKDIESVYKAIEGYMLTTLHMTRP